jgi:hypothetical protein
MSQLGFEPITSENMSLKLSLLSYNASNMYWNVRGLNLGRALTNLIEVFVAFLPRSKHLME